MRARVDAALMTRLTARGSRLREVRRELLRQQPGSTQRWFQGPDGTDLFLWYDERRGLSQVQLTFEKRVIEWEHGQAVKTGRLASFNPLTPQDDQARLVFDAAPDGETLAMARAVLLEADVDDLTLALVRANLGLRTQ